MNVSFIILMLTSLLVVATACDKKTQSVSDPGPNFTLVSESLKFNAGVPATVKLKRQDPHSGPLVHILPGDIATIKSSEKRIFCGNQRLFVAPTTYAPESDVFSFQISESEFPGLSQLPLVSQCTLETIIKNQVGSILTQRSQIVIKFDMQPALVIERNSVTPGVFPASLILKNHMLLVQYLIENKTDLAQAFLFRPQQKVKARAIYFFKSIPHTDDIFNNSGVRYSRNILDIEPAAIEISSNAQDVSGDLIHEVRFKVGPKQRVRVAALAILPESYTIPMTVGPESEPVLSGGRHSMNRTFSGVFILERTPASQDSSLVLARSFELSPQDLREPLSAVFIDGGAFFRGEDAPNMNAMLTRF